MLSKEILIRIRAVARILEGPDYTSSTDRLTLLSALVEKCLEIQTREAIHAVQTAVERKLDQ